MLKDIAGIRVCGANFENSSDICGCQVRNKKIYKKISPTRVSVGSEPI